LCEPVGLCIDDYFLIDDDTISFINTSDYWLDLESFESGTEKCKGISGRNINENQASILEKSIQHYIGDLLEGNYEDWVLYERERYRIAYLNALYKLMVFHGCAGNFEQGLSYGEAILARDITREKVHRQMMWLYSLADNRDAAIKQFKQCRQILKDELGIPPMLETQKIYALILQNKFQPDSWDGDARLPARSQLFRDNSICTLIRSALDKLNQLQETIEGTTMELLLIEKMINETLAQKSQETRK
jgi:DNA-binding SARP family transcriptional activator